MEQLWDKLFWPLCWVDNGNASFFLLLLCVGFVEAHRHDIVNTLQALVGKVIKMLPAESRYQQLCDKLGLSDKVPQADGGFSSRWVILVA